MDRVNRKSFKKPTFSRFPRSINKTLYKKIDDQQVVDEASEVIKINFDNIFQKLKIIPVKMLWHP